MFKDTLKEIDHEVEWINYELTRQSTTGEKEEMLKARKTALKIIRVLCQDFQLAESLSQPLFGSEEVRALLGEQLPCKAASDVQPSSSQSKQRQLPPLTNIPHSEYHVQLREDNSLYWELFDLTIPPTPKGKIDKKRLESEMIARTSFHRR